MSISVRGYMRNGKAVRAYTRGGGGKSGGKSASRSGSGFSAALSARSKDKKDMMAKASFAVGTKASFRDKNKMKYLMKPAGYSKAVIKGKSVGSTSDGRKVYLSGGKGRKVHSQSPYPASMQNKYPTLYKANPPKKQRGW